MTWNLQILKYIYRGTWYMDTAISMNPIENHGHINIILIRGTRKIDCGSQIKPKINAKVYLQAV